jgi:peptidyl-prolyl cis-trans isomerase C
VLPLDLSDRPPRSARSWAFLSLGDAECTAAGEARLRGVLSRPAPHKQAGPVRRFLARVGSESLAHFLIGGLALFVAGRVYETETSRYRISVTAQHVAQLANAYVQQFGARPDAPTLEALVQRDVHDEILYREGLVLKLDEDDEIVRRRVVQKMQFLMQDLDAPPEPTELQLQAYYNVHASRYVTPQRVTFTHVYFSADKAGDTAARVRATTVLATLSNSSMTRAPDRGDPFPDVYDFAAYEPEQVYRLFGHTPFADAVFSTPPGQWAGPFRSTYGWHLIYVEAHQNAERPPLTAVRDRVREDYVQEAEDHSNEASFNRLAQRFMIVREDQAPTR